MHMEGVRMELLTAPEAATFLRISERKLAGLRSSGDGPKYSRILQGNKGVRYRRQDLESWIENRGVSSAAP
jgi:hypothetical protein